MESEKSASFSSMEESKKSFSSSVRADRKSKQLCLFSSAKGKRKKPSNRVSLQSFNPYFHANLLYYDGFFKSFKIIYKCYMVQCCQFRRLVKCFYLRRYDERSRDYQELLLRHFSHILIFLKVNNNQVLTF